MTPQELKKSLLSLAFKGKITTQNKEESSSLLLDKILKSGFGSKRYLQFTDDLSPHDIPDNWSWCMFHQVVSLENGERTKKLKLPYLEAKYLRGNAEAKYLEKGHVVKPGSKVILVDGENSGEVFIVPEKGYMGSTFKLLNIASSVDEHFVLFFMKLHQSDYRNNKKGAAIPHLDKKVFFEMPFPIPPLEEQKRIVAKIDELLPLVDQYEEAWNKLEKFNSKFPIDMKKSILQLAMCGRLVEQKVDEGSGKELLKEIIEQKNALIKQKRIDKDKKTTPVIEDEIPYEIPFSWCWTKLQTILDKLVDGDHNPPQGVNCETEYWMLSSTNIGDGVIEKLDKKRFLTKEVFELENERTRATKGDIFFTSVGTLGRSCIYDGEGNYCFQRSVSIMHTLIYNKFLKYYFDSPYFQSMVVREATGTAQKGFYLQQLANSYIPIPPLEEQKRIVAKLEELLPLCRKLVK